MDKKEEQFNVIAPRLIQQNWNEAEVLGSVVWLWLYSKRHKEMPLHTLPTILLPAIKHQKFILGIESAKPVFYLSWADFSPEAESRYIQHPLNLSDEDWSSGDRMWIIDWVAPFGHSKVMSDLLKRKLFVNKWMRAQYHRGTERGKTIIKTFNGVGVMPEEMKYWFETHPIEYSIKDKK